MLAGERLGNLDHVTLNRESPSHVTDVELAVKLTDSLLAQGLSGCRLAANFEGDSTHDGVNIRVNRDRDGAFRCLPGDSTPPDLVEYGVATFSPGDVEVPLLLPAEVVKELQELDFAVDSARASAGDSLRGDHRAQCRLDRSSGGARSGRGPIPFAPPPGSFATRSAPRRASA